MWQARRGGCGGILMAAVLLAGCSPAAKVETSADSPPDELRRNGVIVLGSPHLFGGIPGSDKLKLDEIRRWLARDEVHRPLEVCLPLGFDELTAAEFIPADNPLTLAKIELGRQLFFDRRLSRNQTASCGDCHNPPQAYANYFFDENRRDPAVAFNRLFSTAQFWDGHAASLEAQPKTPLEREDELNLPPAELVARLRSIPGYEVQFETIFDGVSLEAVGQALACFERAIVSSPAPWDYHAAFERLTAKPADELTADERAVLTAAEEGKRQFPLSEAARRGAKLFFSERLNCSECHSGPNFTDERFHNLGIGMNLAEPDLGRFEVTEQDEDRGAFKTPTLRNLSRSAPYFHNGHSRRLEDVIQYLNFGCQPNEHLSPLIRPLDLSAEEQQELLAFLESLNSPLPNPRQDRLPE